MAASAKKVGCEEELERLLVTTTKVVAVVVVAVVDEGTQGPLTMRSSRGRLLVRRCSRDRGPSDIIRSSKDVLIGKDSLGVLHGEPSRDPTTIEWIKGRGWRRILLLLILINRRPMHVIILSIGVLELTKRRGQRKSCLLLKTTEMLIGLLLAIAKVGEEPLQRMTGRTAATTSAVLRRDSFPLKGTNMARGGVNSLFKNSTNSLEQEVSK